MPSRITVFDHFGTPLAELTTTTARSWVLDGIGRCTFPLASFKDVNCNRNTLQYCNFLLVEHIPTIDAAGNVRGTLPPWVGIILPPQQWDYGRLTVTAYSAEALLSSRPMPYVNAAGSAGTIFAAMLQYANAIGGFPIVPGAIYPFSEGANIPLRLSMYEEAQNLSKIFAQDFDILPSRSVSNQLILTANWYQQKGVTVNAVFSEGYLGNMKLPSLTEQGSLSNYVNGYNIASSNGTRIFANVQDQASQGDYGVLGSNINLSAGNLAGVTTGATNALYSASRPTTTLELTALDSGITFTGLAVGNVWNVVLNSVGFYGGGIGFSGAVRLTGVEYDDWTNEARLTTQVLTGSLTRENYA